MSVQEPPRAIFGAARELIKIILMIPFCAVIVDYIFDALPLVLSVKK